MADLIEREKVLKILRIIGHGRPISGKRAISLISEMPSASMWIPCSERLPESREDVFVWFEYFRYGEYNCMYQTYNIGNYFAKYDSWMVGHETGWQKLRVIAWMPLPEPPEKE